MTERRTAHPFHMYDAMQAQPDCVARVLTSQQQTILRAAEAAAGRHRIFLCGIGTSYHAAMVAAHLLRHFMSGLHAAVGQSFEFVHYPTSLHAEDAVIVISHRGWKGYSVQALSAARAAGALAVAFTGQGGEQGMGSADFLVETCAQEASAAHTKSYTSALAALALFAIRVAECRRYVTPEDATRAAAALADAPQLQRAALGLEPQVKKLAPLMAQRSRWIFLGAGPNWATACEGALKVKETAYTAAEGLQVEQFLHGPIAEVGEHTAVVAHMAGGSGDYRTAAALRAVSELGALRVLVATQGAAPDDAAAEHVLTLPVVSEWRSPLVHVVPLQLLAYFAALERGTNPDTCRRDQPAHTRAHQHYDL